MRGRSTHRAMLVILLLCQLPICLATETKDANESDKYLDAVREFADNVLEYGRDTYGPKHTPLFVDGLNIHNHEPVKWISPKGDYATATDTEEWILSNFASQQTLLRTLDGLSNVTGDAKYRQAAMDAIRYAFDHLRTPNGLLYWGHATAYDALGDTPRGNTLIESIKLHYPYYELMWAADSDATNKLIEALWCAHVMDWSNLDFNRNGIITANLEEPWNHEYKGGPTFFKSKHGGGGFFRTATSLVHAGTALHRLLHQEQPLIWSKRLVKRFIDTRHPNTGIANWIYNNPDPTPPLGEDLRQRFVDPRITIFPLLPFEENEHDMYWPENVEAHGWISLFLVDDMLGDKVREFSRWALEEFIAWGRASYRKRDNSFVPLLTDGTSIEGYVCKESNRYAPKGAVAKPVFADLTFFWGYTVAYRATSNEFMWEMVRDIAFGNHLGDIGQTPVHTPDLQIETTCSSVYGLLGFLELYAKTKKRVYLEMAQRIGDNILLNQFHKGFFVPSNRHIYTRFDCFEPLALLHLHVATTSKAESVPRVWPSVPLFVPPYRYKQQGIDLRIIYTLTESSEPPLSLQEAAAIGDIELVRFLLDKGIGVDSWDDSFKKTALQRAAISGHKDVVELLITKGARIGRQNSFPGVTALQYAAEKGHKEIVELLIAEGADVNAKRTGFPAGATPLHSAARVGHKDIVELLIANGADVNAKNNEGKTPADIAASRNRSKVVKLLIEKGADVSLDVAARFGALAKVKSLIEEGVDINAKDGSGKTALYYAVGARHKDIVELLLTKGADVSLAPGDDNPLLNRAIWRGDAEMAKLLVNHGAKFDIKDEDGRTAFRYAADGGHRDLVEFFVSKGADISSFHMAACVGDLTRMKHFVDEGVNVDTKDELGWTPLCWAASTGQTEAAEFLIANGANVDAKTDFKRAPLHQAAIVGELSLVQLFISRGANVNVKDWRGRTPLWWANRRGHTEIVELLKKHVANLASNSEPRHDLAITGISAVKRDLRDYNVPVVVNIENRGKCGESFDVKLIDVTDGKVIGNKSVTLSALGEDGMDEICDLTLTGETGGEQAFGAWLAVGDVNGDGYDDILVSAARYNNKQGRVYLYYGGKNMDENADIIFTGENIGDELGDGDMCLGDLNNDNFDDVIIGARCFNNSRGRVYIYYGGQHMDKNVDITIDGEVIDSRFGHTIVVGDINGDGYNDLIIGANKYDNYTGRAYLYYGGDSFDTIADKTFTGEGTNDVFSHQMSLADVDGDNCDDLLVGTRFYPDLNTNPRGRAYLYYGAPGTTMDEICDVTFEAENDHDRFGSSINSFDIDNDGHADVMIGARGWGRAQGRGYIYWGSSRVTMDNNPDLCLNGELGSHMGGDSVHCGYVNGDKYGDIIFIGYAYDRGRGRAYLYYGGPKASTNDVCDHTFTGEVPSSTPMRVKVADFNGDRYGDVVIGGWGYNNLQGRVWLYYGGPGDSTQLKFDWNTNNVSPGKHILKATIEPVQREEDTADNTMTVEVEVKEPSK